MGNPEPVAVSGSAAKASAEPSEGHPRFGIFVALATLISTLSLVGMTVCFTALYHGTRGVLVAGLETRAADAALFGARLATDPFLTRDRYALFQLADGVAKGTSGGWLGAGVWRLDGSNVVTSEAFPTGEQGRRGLRTPPPDPAVGGQWRGWGPYRMRIQPILAGGDRVGYFGVLFDERAANRDLAPVVEVGWAVGGGLLLLSVLVSIPLSLWITGPIRRLDAAAAQVATGDVTVRADERAWGEAGSLARQFNRMMERIENLVHEVREAERRARQAQQLASLAQLGGGLAHEIKNPLTTVKLLVESMRAGAVGGDVLEIRGDDLSLLVEQVAKIDSTLEEFVEFARPSPLRVSRLHVDEVVDAVVRGLSLQAHKQGRSIHIVKPIGAVAVRADRLRLEQTLGNLLRNALNHGPEGSPVRIGWETRGDRVILWVEDDGPGVPSSLRDRIFDPFFTTRDKGLGLGLAIARSAADQHGWELTVADTTCVGARFELCITVE